jgi:hypothetical protein
VILVDGRFRVDLSECSVTLASQGDYLMRGRPTHGVDEDRAVTMVFSMVARHPA